MNTTERLREIERQEEALRIEVRQAGWDVVGTNEKASQALRNFLHFAADGLLEAAHQLSRAIKVTSGRRR